METRDGGQESGLQGLKPGDSLGASVGTTEVAPFPVAASFGARNGMGLPPCKCLKAQGIYGRARAEDKKLRKELTLGGPYLEGTLRKPIQCFRIEPRGRGDSGNQSLLNH